MIIVMLVGPGDSTKYFYNALKLDYNISKVLLTEIPSKKEMIKRRIKKLRLFHVINQLIFQVMVIKILNSINNKKIKNRKASLNLDPDEIPNEKILRVGSVNSKKTIEILKKLKPDVVLVNGTSIITNKVLSSIDSIFINTHVGITPEYRGVHGGYWALRNNDAANFGVTVHIVDKGIDTGSIIYQKTKGYREAIIF